MMPAEKGLGMRCSEDVSIVSLAVSGEPWMRQNVTQLVIPAPGTGQTDGGRSPARPRADGRRTSLALSLSLDVWAR